VNALVLFHIEQSGENLGNLKEQSHLEFALELMLTRLPGACILLLAFLERGTRLAPPPVPPGYARLNARDRRLSTQCIVNV
jgi:hypothetical protein